MNYHYVTAIDTIRAFEPFGKVLAQYIVKLKLKEVNVENLSKKLERKGGEKKERMKKIVWITLLCVAVFFGSQVHATVVTFTEVHDWYPDLTQYDLTNEYSAYGLSFSHAYWYYDERDPWVDHMGISNGKIKENWVGDIEGRVNFIGGSTYYVTFDWWVIAPAVNGIEVIGYDTHGNVVDVYSVSAGTPIRFGTGTITGPIAYFTFEDDGGFVQISKLSYDISYSVPEPLTLLLLGSGLIGLAGLRRKFRK